MGSDTYSYPYPPFGVLPLKQGESADTIQIVECTYYLIALFVSVSKS